MKEETKIELMKIAAQLTSDVVAHKNQGITAGKTKGVSIDIKDVFTDCLAGVKDQFDNLGQ